MRLFRARFFQAALVLTVVALATHCAEHTQPSVKTRVDPAPQTGSVDLTLAIARARSAFRPLNDGFRGRAAHHEAWVRDNELSFRPVFAPAVERAGIVPSALRLAATELARGAETWRAANATPHLGGEGAVEVSRGPATEHWINGPEGVEQS